MYKTLTGVIPPDAMDRLRGTPLPEITAPVSETAKNAIYQGMAVAAKDRIQTMTELLNKLESKNETATVTEPVTEAKAPVTETVTETVQAPAPAKKAKSRKPFIIIGSVAAAVVIFVGVAMALSGGNNKIEQVDAEVTTTSATTTTTAELTTTTTATTAATTATTTTAATDRIDLPINTSDPKGYGVVLPDFSSLTLEEQYGEFDNGRTMFCSHVTKDNKVSGFVMEYVENSFMKLTVMLDGEEYGKGQSTTIYIPIKDDGSSSYLQIAESYKYIWHGDVLDIGSFSSPDFYWWTADNGIMQGLDYHYDGTEFTKAVYNNGELQGDFEKVEKRTTEQGNSVWHLGNDDSKLDFYSRENDSQLVFSNGKAYEYWGWTKREDGRILCGQVIENSFNGMGISVGINKDVYLGQLRNGKMDGYGLYIRKDGSAALVKYENDKGVEIQDLPTVKLDTSIFLK
jgi:hypothetical protein